MIDLLKILKTGDLVYSLIADRMVKIRAIDLSDDFPIKTAGAGKAKERGYNKYGSVLLNGSDSLLFPSKEEKDWSNYCPFKKGEIVFASNPSINNSNTIGVFSHKEDGVNYLFAGKDIVGNLLYDKFENCEYITL